VKALLAFVLVLASVQPLHAALGEIKITSFIRISDDLGEVRGKVILNEDKGAFVTCTNGAAKYSTLTDENGAFSVVIALRSNRVEAYARGLDGSAGRGATEAALDKNQPPFGPAPAELYALTKGILNGSIQVTSANAERLAQLMDQSIMHQGGWEFDNRMVLLLLGCTGRIVETMGTATAAEQAALNTHLSKLGQLLYKGVVRGMDGNPPGSN
jgi:hypothetical protein